jgi:hypothetical protein
MSEFKADRIFRTNTIQVEAPPEKVFPLLCPMREYDWVEPWKCEMVYTDSGFVEDHCVFRTDFEDQGEAIWMVSRHEPETGIIQFVITCPATHVENLDIAVAPIDVASSRIRWNRTYTALNERGNAFIKELTGPGYDDEIYGLEAMLNHFCRTGEMLPVAELAK